MTYADLYDMAAARSPGCFLWLQNVFPATTMPMARGRPVLVGLRWCNDVR
jgi:hypothetical protein